MNWNKQIRNITYIEQSVWTNELLFELMLYDHLGSNIQNGGLSNTMCYGDCKHIL